MQLSTIFFYFRRLGILAFLQGFAIGLLKLSERCLVRLEPLLSLFHQSTEFLHFIVVISLLRRHSLLVFFSGFLVVKVYLVGSFAIVQVNGT